MTTGVVTKIDGTEITVRTACQTACEKCSLHEGCSLRNNFREIKITVPEAERYQIGETVQLSVTAKNIWISVFWAYLMPLIIVLTVLTGFSLLKYTETQCALASLVGLGIYYTGLCFLNERLKKQLNIEVKKNPVD